MTFEEVAKDFVARFSQTVSAIKEQIALTRQCRMRRFYVFKDGEEIALGVVFPDYTTISQDYVTGTLHNYDDPKRIEDAGLVIHWIDVVE